MQTAQVLPADLMVEIVGKRATAARTVQYHGSVTEFVKLLASQRCQPSPQDLKYR
jgi:hypothetical protein